MGWVIGISIWIGICLVIYVVQSLSHRGKLRRLKLLGVDPTRYIPSFSYLKGVPQAAADFTDDHTAIFSAPDHFIFYSVDREMYEGEHPKEKPWRFIGSELYRLPKGEVTDVVPYVRPREEVEEQRTPVTDFLVNQVAGLFCGAKIKTVPFAAFLIIGKASDPDNPMIFGVPDGPIGVRHSFDFLGGILPDTASQYLDYGSAALDLLDFRLDDSPAAKHVKQAAAGLLISLDQFQASRPKPPPLPR